MIFYLLIINIYIIFSSWTFQLPLAQQIIFDEIHENRPYESQEFLSCLHKMSKIIQLAKSAAEQMNSPPRIYQTSGNSLSLWPDQPGKLETTYETHGMRRPSEDIFAGTSTMTLRTVLVKAKKLDSYEVIFQAEWGPSTKILIHTWKFHVNTDRQVTFIEEKGDDLPPLPI